MSAAYRVSNSVGGEMIRCQTAREAYYHARREARVARLIGHYTATAWITRVYNGDNQEYQHNPITRLVTAWG
jgi:hypothetical protein